MLLGERGIRWALECLQQGVKSQPAPGPAPKASTPPCASQGLNLVLPLYGLCFAPMSQSFPISARLPETFTSLVARPLQLTGALSHGKGSSRFQHRSHSQAQPHCRNSREQQLFHG